MTKQSILNPDTNLKSPSRRHLLTGGTALAVAGLAGLNRTAIAQAVSSPAAAGANDKTSAGLPPRTGLGHGAKAFDF